MGHGHGGTVYWENITNGRGIGILAGSTFGTFKEAKWRRIGILGLGRYIGIGIDGRSVWAKGIIINS